MDVRDLSTPCYIINSDDYDKNLDDFKKAFVEQWKGNVIFGYSVKTNNFPYMLKRAMEKGFYAEVVSPDEFQFAEKCGCSLNKIIFNGPQKKDYLRKACLSGTIVNLDNLEEVAEVCSLPSAIKEKLILGLRVNFDLESLCKGETTCEGIPGRFGICYENGDLKKAIGLLKKNGIILSGLHMHQSSKTRSLKVFENIALKAIEIAEVYGLNNLKYIDVGGGFFGGNYFLGKPSFLEYSEVVCGKLKRYFNPDNTKLILEPGAAVLATSMDYLTSVLNIRDVRGQKIVTVDGSLLHVNPTMRQHPIPCTVIDPGEKCKYEQIVGGSTCMELDRFLPRDFHQTVTHSSKFLFHCCGAYMSTHNSSFINAAPNIYLKKCAEYILVREKSIEELFRNKL